MSRDEPDLSERRSDFLKRIDYRLTEIETNIKLRHEENIHHHNDMNHRIDRLDDRIKTGEQDRQKIRGELEHNAEIIRQIKEDTSQIILYSKWFNAVRRFLLWAVPLVSSGVTAYITWITAKKS